MRFRRCGADAVLVELAGASEVDTARAALDEARQRGELPDLVELLPGARTVLAAVRPGSRGLDAVRAVLADTNLTAPPAREAREITLPVRYDGPDLELVAETAGLSTTEVAERHVAGEYTVAFCGFAPGFGYLNGLDAALQQPRLDTPRTRVPAGSVGVAGEFTAVYPGASPGGWRLIGSCDVPLFDPHGQPPAVLAPGDRVRFEVRS
ncbi:MAG: carboxyltransferase domain-containing protein [Pseudonocardiaceae bacterium]|nr:carboxyltransferase domain-containing protein [Pseudonocardiaceae bacterium]